MHEISDIGSVQSVVSQIHQRGIRDVVLSPGSRNAPFILSFTNVPSFLCQSVLDERSAGFIALGIAQQKKKPVVLSCTSGSAVLNYTPALVEAYYQRVPLICLTSDRPAAWIDQGEGQSIRQVGLLDKVVAGSFALVEEKDDTDRWYNLRMINEALELATAQSRPVHINIPLSEPLYGTAPCDLEEARCFRFVKPGAGFSEAQLTGFRRIWESSERIAIVATDGAEAESLQRALTRFHDDPRVAVITETSANLYHLGYISCIDRTIEAFLGKEVEADFIPELLITIGGNIISKKFKALLRKHRQLVTHHWHFGSEVMDTFQSLTMLIDGEPNGVLSRFAPAENWVKEGFGNRWKSVFFEMEAKHQAFLATCPYSDLSAFASVLEAIPEGAVLQMGNSSVVRYVQLFNQIKGVGYFGNRGVSGIEGCTSTAIGAAQADTDRLTVLISGDQSFRYDTGALMHAKSLKQLRMIVVNNGGGNIFRIIDGPARHQISEDFIEKKDESSVEGLVLHHKLDYLSAHNMDELEERLGDLFSADRLNPAVLEVFTPRVESPEVLKAYFRFLGGKL
jgi:2-succinyl-5-enolpyruvyl-6-hydroxy-3-cyclohexene-1-carboxylate synthase